MILTHSGVYMEGMIQLAYQGPMLTLRRSRQSHLLPSYIDTGGFSEFFKVNVNIMKRRDTEDRRNSWFIVHVSIMTFVSSESLSPH